MQKLKIIPLPLLAIAFFSLGGCQALQQPFTLNAPSALQYTGNTFSLNTGKAIGLIAPLGVIYGAKTCAATPALPAGLVLNNETCVISGTPTALGAATNYTITATNRYGSSSGTLTLEVIGITYSAISYNYTSGIPLATINATTSGSFSSCAINPALVAGLTLDTNTCAISGTPAAMEGVITYTISANNSNGVTTASITLIGNYTIGGTLSGILTSGVVLRKQNGDDLTVAANGTFTFATGTPVGQAYSISIITQPGDTRCIIQNADGIANAAVSNIIVTCPVGIKNGRLWMRCAYGQVWNTTAGNCTGAGSAANDIWGGVQVQYCASGDAACNDTNPAGEAGNVSGHLNGLGSSGAWDACNNMNAGAGTYGTNTWRVPRKSELGGLITGSTNPTIDTAMFPNTIYNFNGAAYWTSSSYNPATNFAVWYVYFSTGNGLIALNNGKTNNFYVRCVSDL